MFNFQGNTETVTITANPDYTRLRCCGTNAINSVTSTFSCHTNDCMCRSDRMSSAIIAIQNGALGSCSNIDANSAAAVYIGYCEANGYTRPSFATTVTVSSPKGECNNYSTPTNLLISLLVALKGTLIKYHTFNLCWAMVVCTIVQRRVFAMVLK